MTSKIYRPNVAIIVLNHSGHLLACRRADKHKGWQLPQGGIEVGETPLEAMYRELKEEIGTDLVEVIKQLPRTISYDWPQDLHYRGYHGQVQHYFLVRLLEANSVSLEEASCDEFDDIEWLGISEFISRVNGFKLKAYREALDEFHKLLPNTIVA